MGLERFSRKVSGDEANILNKEAQLETISAHTIYEFINLLKSEHMAGVNAISSVTKIGNNFVFSNLLTASNEQTHIRFVEAYEKLSLLKAVSVSNKLKATTRTLITAQHRLKLIQLEVPAVTTSQLSNTTKEPLTQEDLQRVEEMRIKYHAIPYPILGE